MLRKNGHNVYQTKSKLKMKPWEKYKELSASEYMNLDRLIEKIREVYMSNRVASKRAAALVAILYLTGCRVSELIREDETKVRKYVTSTGEQRTVTYPAPTLEGLKLGDIKVRDSNNKKQYSAEELSQMDENDLQGCWIIITVFVKKEREVAYRDVFIKYDKDSIYYPMLEVFLDYMTKRELFFGDDNNKPVFTLNANYAKKLVAKFFNFSPHAFRDLRATHLMRYNNFTVVELQQFFAWKTATMPLHYTKANVQDIMRKLE